MKVQALVFDDDGKPDAATVVISRQEMQAVVKLVSRNPAELEERLPRHSSAALHMYKSLTEMVFNPYWGGGVDEAISLSRPCAECPKCLLPCDDTEEYCVHCGARVGSPVVIETTAADGIRQRLRAATILYLTRKGVLLDHLAACDAMLANGSNPLTLASFLVNESAAELRNALVAMYAACKTASSDMSDSDIAMIIAEEYSRCHADALSSNITEQPEVPE